ncbi:MAG: hypothetical protein GX927_11965 [Lentisphaerae bacterium]|nr:hypothetical protein [Lentisphaerota bacterium]
MRSKRENVNITLFQNSAIQAQKIFRKKVANGNASVVQASGEWDTKCGVQGAQV